MSRSSIEKSFNSIVGQREVLRQKLYRMLKELNGGKTTISLWGFEIDIVQQIETFLAKASDTQVEKALRIMRD